MVSASFGGGAGIPWAVWVVEKFIPVLSLLLNEYGAILFHTFIEASNISMQLVLVHYLVLLMQGWVECIDAAAIYYVSCQCQQCNTSSLETPLTIMMTTRSTTAAQGTPSVRPAFAYVLSL